MEEQEKIKHFIEKKEQEPVLEKEPLKKERKPEPEKKETKEKDAILEKTNQVNQEEISEIDNAQMPAKVKKLFQVAEEKGLLQAIELVKKTGDAHLIDVFRDRLAEDNYYKKFKR